MDFSDKHIVLILLIIIIFSFIYNYDVYIIKKGEELCKPVFVTKRIISPEIQPQLTINNNNNNNNLEKFSNLPLPNLSNINLSYIHPSKINIIYNVLSVLKNTPSDLPNNDIIKLLEFYFYVFNSSSSINDFYSNLSKSNLINESPYNSNYSKLVLYLLSEFSCDSYKSNSVINNYLNNDIDLVFNKKINNIDNKKINNIDNKKININEITDTRIFKPKKRICKK